MDKEIIEQHGLSEEEYQRILTLLGREPNRLELGLFSVMWSEHCSYKSSRFHLRKFPTTGERVLQGPGENAGAVDIGDGLAVVFKIESHNHPSFIEPYQGAATGVGGILRDIFTMGARPIALLNSLRFGPLESPKNRYLLEGVVAGIAGYGNCMGIPTIGGEIYFNEIYNQNPLVNVFCLGVVKKDRIFRASASGIGNTVIYLGSRTGRDGIHGATMASEGFDESIESRRPTVQVGDPFTEKLLLEACLEIMKQDLVVAIQDMGAAGLSSSSVEMAGRGGTGIEMELARVPRREEGMTPYELMLSESQERMLLVAKPGREDAILAICAKWDLDVAAIGRVTDTRRLVLKNDGRIVADLPIPALTDDAPVYERPMETPLYLDSLQGINLDTIPQPKDFGATLIAMLASPTIGSKRWVYQQYDYMVRTNTVIRPGFESGVVRIKGTRKALAISLDGNGAYGILNPYRGGVIAVCEAARNVICAGARPIGLTDCLNFGNPERPDVMWQFALSVEGIADACRELAIPVVSGNVSFYNETHGLGIYPTSIVGVVGLIEEVDRVVRPGFRDAGDRIVLLGETKDELGGSEYLRRIHTREGGYPPLLDLAVEKALHNCCLSAIEAGIIRSAHDCSEGGLAVALAEAAILSGPMSESARGASVTLQNLPIRMDAYLFGETQSRIVVTVSETRLDELEKHCAENEVPMAVIGRVEGDRLTVGIEGWGRPLIDLPVETIRTVWNRAVASYFDEREKEGR
ncbi:MAG: phosphoribosylformylglycinamidine synthase subunit PurL [Nitrospirae bacterium]|nr:phosphoribosylformylglycinamidine synthase subunit PurL [Nitrospirota bacterium]